MIIGGGLTGLMCALHLHRHRKDYILVEAAGRVGGRVWTDFQDGFLLDRGFQVYLDSYDQGIPYLDLTKLDVGYFSTGAYIQGSSGRSYFGDPLREPSSLLSTLISSAASPLDKWKLFRLAQSLKQKSDEEIWSAPEVPTAAFLRSLGFSQKVQHSFLSPFFGGVFLDDSLGVSSRLFQFLYKRFALGRACLPRQGMAAIPQQLFRQLDPQRILLHQQVAGLEGCEIKTESGMKLRGRHVLCAMDQPSAFSLMGWRLEKTHSRSTRVYYFATEENPFLDRPALLLNGNPEGPIRHMSFPSLVQPSYAPTGWHLVSVTTRNDISGHVTEMNEKTIALKAGEAFDINTHHWNFLRSYHVLHGLPVMASMSGPGFMEIREGVWLAGDYLTYPSINGAFQSANQLASHLLAD